MKCLYCDSDDHPWFNCRKKPEGWKPPKQLGAVTGDETARVNLRQPVVRGPQATIAERTAVDHRSPKATIATPSKSTAAQKGVHADGIPSQAGSAGTEVAPRPPRMDRQVHGEGRKVNVGAGTQAPPVDTYPRIEGAKFVANVPEGTQLLRYGNRVLAAGPGLAPSIVTVDGLVPLTVPLSELKMGGRPKTMTAEERRAYKRVKEQERRDGLKRAEQGE